MSRLSLHTALFCALCLAAAPPAPPTASARGQAVKPDAPTIPERGTSAPPSR